MTIYSSADFDAMVDIAGEAMRRAEIAEVQNVINDRDLKALTEQNDFHKRQVFALLLEIARLKGLIKSVEHRGSGDRCPWYECNRWSSTLHDPDCPAFTPDGEVK